MDPCISPDGNQIAFSKMTKGGDGVYDIHIMDIMGNNIKNVSNINGQDYSPSWNKNSNLIIFWGGWWNNQPTKIFITIIKDAEVKPIKTLDYNSGISSFWPSGRMSISSGDKVVYAVNNGPNTDGLTSGLCLMNLDGSGFEVLLYAPQNKYIESPWFSPDDTSIGYIIVTLENWEYKKMSIHILNLITDRIEKIYESEIKGAEWSDPSNNNSIWLCWSPDGSKILFTKPIEHFSSYIYVMNSDGSELTQVTSAEGVTDRSISWSN